MCVIVKAESMDSTGDIGLHIGLIESVRLTTIRGGSLAFSLTLVLKPNGD